MDNIVYVLGAGFSAPLGLPVMTNFISKAHDIYQNERDNYPNFGVVFQNIKNKLASIALVYNADLDNIEEVLSILEMERLAGEMSPKETSDLNKFLIDVIKYFTPSINGVENFRAISKGIYESKDEIKVSKFESEIFLNDLDRYYIKYILQLFNAEILIEGIEKEGYIQNQSQKNMFSSFQIECKKLSILQANYSIISLNYDMILENFADYLSTISRGYAIKFSRPQSKRKDVSPILAKLHGSIDTNTIVPPTWNKTIQHKIDLEWKEAHRVLSHANQIRFIGYSLPDADAYIKYLLKSSIIKSENLKNIDIICLDPKGIVRAKYKEFIAPQYRSRYRFVSANTLEYLQMVYYDIETGHEKFFATNFRDIG